jgi:hypothetical protein
MDSIKNCRNEVLRLGLVDLDTGQVIDDTIELECGEALSKKASVKEKRDYIKRHILKFRSDKRFIKMWNGSGLALRQELTNAEIGFMVGLTDLVCYQDNVIRRDGDTRGKALNKKEIGEVLGESARNTTKLINSLIDKEVLKAYEYLNEDSNKMVKCFVFNPFIYFRGRDLHKDIYDLFKTSRWTEI